MPAALGQYFTIQWRAIGTPRPRVLVAAGAGLIVVAVAWSMIGVDDANAGTHVVPLYPAVQTTVPMVDASQDTVADLVRQLPLASHYEMLALSGGVMASLDGTGPYTLFIPADNYFDYLPRSAYVGLTNVQRAELAAHMVVAGSALPIDESRAGSYLTLAGDEIQFAPRDSDSSAAVGDAGSGGYIIRGYKAKNGVVYITNKVLVPNDLQFALGS